MDDMSWPANDFFQDILQENVVDLFTNERSQTQKLSINPVQDSFEEISFSWVFAVKQFQKLKKLNRLWLNWIVLNLKDMCKQYLNDHTLSILLACFWHSLEEQISDQ
jgi:hypothetical protein